MKGDGVLDGDTRHAAEAIEIKGSDVALWPDDCGMGGNHRRGVNGGIGGGGDRWSSGDDLDAIGSGEHRRCCHRLGIGGSIIEGEGTLPYAGRRMTGAGGRHALALYGAADFQEACGDLLACLLRRAGRERRDGQRGRERLCFRHQRHCCSQRRHRSDEDGNEKEGQQVQEETATQPYEKERRHTSTPQLHRRRGKWGRDVETARRRDGRGNRRVPTLLARYCWRRWRCDRLVRCILFFRVRLVCPCFLPFPLIGDRSEYQRRSVL